MGATPSQDNPPPPSYDELYKVLLIGGERVGKTSLQRRFQRHPFNEDTAPTTSVDYVFAKIPYIVVNGEGEWKKIQKPAINTLIWDTCGQHRYWQLVPSFTRDANVLVAIYDVTWRESMHEALWRVESHAQETGLSVPVLLVGCKADLENLREVSFEDGSKAAEERGYQFLEVSAKTGDNVERVFGMVAAACTGSC
ncbi:P-loop containing nucleoside triphosphate hydrolase protein [Aspergillus campestris IBT 28561]|uniref:P-loop containing nucleoside triphosphate hydrolase protein n=1 Tax=Aspergillus campestris (strain IBT 28561) TaxID=1392248 RepID=A0A2I1D5E8_ASPC2|nr:P-loop containing nucleoside triphosphate hydrolase protein [Aspergillus campestris IBT 28561]PKY05101.1 P-loop containing nucleoside triphosphate hydrolase protein [Aspergillus campestris IBT 28561]